MKNFLKIFLPLLTVYLGIIFYAGAAPVSNIFRNIIPETTNTYELGTTTPAANWLAIYTQNASTTNLTAFGRLLVGGTATSTIRGDSATSTFSWSINIPTGQCYQVNGTCLSSGGITSLNGLTGATQTFSTNGYLGIVSAGTDHLFNATTSPFFGTIFATSTVRLGSLGAGLAELSSTGVLSSSSTLAVNVGGTGAGSFTAGSLLLGSGTGAFTSTSTLTVSKGGTGAATFTAGSLLLGNGTGAFTSTSTLAVNVGGTGATTLTSGSLLVGAGTGAITSTSTLAVNVGGTGAATLTSGDILVGAGTGAITSTSTLAVNKGGSGAASFTAGSVLVGNGTGAFVASTSLGINVAPGTPSSGGSADWIKLGETVATGATTSIDVQFASSTYLKIYVNIPVPYVNANKLIKFNYDTVNHNFRRMLDNGTPVSEADQANVPFHEATVGSYGHLGVFEITNFGGQIKPFIFTDVAFDSTGAIANSTFTYGNYEGANVITAIRLSSGQVRPFATNTAIRVYGSAN